MNEKLALLAIAVGLAFASGPAHSAVQYQFAVSSIDAYDVTTKQIFPLPDGLRNAAAAAQITITNEAFAKGLNVNLNLVADSKTWADLGVIGIDISVVAGIPGITQNLLSFMTPTCTPGFPNESCLNRWIVQLSSLPGHGISGHIYWQQTSDSYHFYLSGNTGELRFQGDALGSTGVSFLGNIETRHVPEPSAMALLALPMVWLGFHLHRRRATECAA